MNKMKLYTEEQIIKCIELSRLTLNNGSGFSKSTILASLSPIELPSDEEIYIEAQVKKDNIKILPFDTASFQFGALWLRDKIQGGNK